MGLLDDAIREHLELKRAHGADPSEVARQEREVLGAARSPATAPSDDAPEAAAGPAEATPPDAPERGGDLPGPEATRTALDRSAPAAPPPEPDAIPEPPVTPDPEPDPDPGPRGSVPADRFAPDPDLDWSDPAPSRADEPDVVPADEEEGEDVLEETPEFLQETPEHDRLWFEQRPPRDFDF
jgi:hypothetical protein